MKRVCLTLVLGALACLGGGCALCPSPFDYDYNAFGGTHDRVERCRGRAGSAFEPADSQMSAVPDMGKPDRATLEMNADSP